MQENTDVKILIDVQQFQGKILKHICSEEFNKQFESTQFSTYEDSKGYRQSMMHGMLVASSMACGCDYLVYTCTRQKEEYGHVIVHQGQEDEYYEECSECHSKNVSVDDSFCSNCGVMFIKTNEGK